jgi:hypothetical protein
MLRRPQPRLRINSQHLRELLASLWVVAGGLLCFSQTASSSQEGAVVLDRVVAVVNNHAILASDLDEEIKLAVLDPGEAGMGVLSPQRALEQLIGRALIQQQIRQEDERWADPSDERVSERLHEIRTELPACVHEHCATEAGWNSFLTAHGLTAPRVETYLRYRLQILGFVEMRFRQGIQIPPAEIERYYRETLLPQFRAGEKLPTLESVAPRIQEILLQRQVNALFDDWLTNLRQQGDIEVLDPTLEVPENAGTTNTSGGGASK